MGKSCKKTHKKVSGECVPNNVVNKRLYARIKKKISKRVKRKGQRWGAYTSGNLVQEYKRKGGKYTGRKRTFGSKKKKSKRRKSKRRKSKRRKSKRRSRKSKKKLKKKRKTRRKQRMSSRYNLRSRKHNIEYEDIFGPDTSDEEEEELSESEKTRIIRDIYSGFLMQLVGDQMISSDGNPSKLIEYMNDKYKRFVGVVCADGDSYEALRSHPRTDIFRDEIVSHHMRGETCAHFLYYDEDGIVHDSWLTGRQCDGGNQFCQNHALLMAYHPELRNDLTMNTVKAMIQLMIFWDKNLLGILKITSKEDFDKNFDNLENTNEKESTSLGVTFGKITIDELRKLVRRRRFKQLRDVIIEELSSFEAITDMAQWI
tara:strand:- start:426 stop:1538 length:1113 start_codon:yes stop_codon:yes gene_type:complete